MVVGITDEVEVRSGYKEMSGGLDGARAEEMVIELIVFFFFVFTWICQGSPLFKSCFLRHEQQ